MSNGDSEVNQPEPDQRVESSAEPPLEEIPDDQNRAATTQAASAVQESLLRVGFVNFDAGNIENTTSGAMVSAELRQHFRRDVYVGIRDREQNIDFLGRIVEGPFHAPHEVSQDSAITRTTVLHPDRTQFRPTYYVYGTIEVLGALTEGEHVVPTPTRPRPYSEIYIFPENRLRQLLEIEGDFYLGHLMGYSRVTVQTRVDNKNFLPRNVGVFGTIGSGKSNTTQVIMEEALRAGWAVVAIDVEGEYVRMNEATDDQNLSRILNSEYNLTASGVNDLRVYVPMSGHSEAANPLSFKIPISELQPEVVADILEFTEAQVRLFGGITDRASRRPQTQTSGRRGPLGAATAVQHRPYSLQDLIDGFNEDGQSRF